MQHFILDAERRVIAVELSAWSRWVRAGGHLEIARTEVRHLLVLTSFAGIDLSFGEGRPAFFETRVLDAGDELECLTSVTLEQAVDLHSDVTGRWRDRADAAWIATRRAVARHSASNSRRST